MFELEDGRMCVKVQAIDQVHLHGKRKKENNAVKVTSINPIYVNFY